jgi:hypothetical protein
MAFTDSAAVSDLSLADRIAIRDDDGKTWVTARVTNLAYLDETAMTDTRITLQLDDGSIRQFDRKPTDLILYNFEK